MSKDINVLLRSAEQLERSGRLAEAAATYQQLLATTPGLPDCWYNLARLQKALGDFDSALASYQQALDHRITGPEEVYLNRGVIYADFLRDDRAAEAALRTALALNPDYVPALLNLANLCEDVGRREESLALYERLLALAPRNSEALSRYASLKGLTGADDLLAVRMRGAISTPATSSIEKASLGFALGKVLDGCGAYDEAFSAYSAANQHSLIAASAQPGKQQRVYDAVAHEAQIDEIIAAFPTAQVIPQSTASMTTRAPIFICGMFRSGSTLVEQVLAGHSRVRAGGELDVIPRLVSRELAPFPARMATVLAPELQSYAKQYEAHLSKIFPGATLVTDKRPDNFLYIGLIKRMFPSARIIHTARDPLDNCLSVFFLHLSHRMGYALDLIDTAHFYKQQLRLMAHWRSLYEDDIFEFDYDRFVHDPRPAVESLLSFCGLDWEENCLNFQHVKNTVKTASVWQVREALYQRSSGRWRNYERHLGKLRDYLGR